MALWLFILLQICAFAESWPTGEINWRDLHKAMAYMRMKSYHGFVILLQILNTYPDALHGSDIISSSAIIPMPLLMTHLIQFPKRTLMPACLANRMLKTTNDGRSGICLSDSLTRCHGISDTLMSDAFGELKRFDRRNQAKFAADRLAEKKDSPPLILAISF
ncbi:hypothetical protein ACJRO7_006508 [Eucalyptus globulus]|uniref:Uncharacterized protein n=1 Tax=Eucalyptus globulus TaxID=34317 RepID=A0ABD3IJ35_EUCGL